MDKLDCGCLHSSGECVVCCAAHCCEEEAPKAKSVKSPVKEDEGEDD